MKIKLLSSFAAALVVGGCWLIDEPSTVTIQTQGSVEVMPDRYQLSLDVAALATTQSEAIGKMNEELELLRKELPRLAGLTSIEMTTGEVEIFGFASAECYERFDRSAERRCPNEEFYSSVRLTIEIGPAELAGNFLSLASELTEADLSAGYFKISDQSQYRARAIEDAVSSARREAEHYAAAAGLRLGNIVKVGPRENDIQYDRAAPVVSAPRPEGLKRTPVQEIRLDLAPRTVSAEVSVTFALEENDAE